MKKENITTRTLQEMKESGEKIAVITSYDYPTAKIAEEAGVDVILVGDSVGNTVLGYKNTIPVTMEDIIHHTKAVARGCGKPLLVSDMPFISYQANTEEAVRNAGRLMKEARAEAVKVEGGRESIEQIKKILDAGIPVMGHLGLTPQRVHQFGGYQPQGRTAEDAERILKDAELLAETGVFSIVLESVPKELAEIITKRLDIPTIGIGAGPHCDGQVLVIHDVLGLGDFSPKFAKQYTDLGSTIKNALKEFSQEIKSESFPTLKYSYEMREEELEKLKDLL